MNDGNSTLIRLPPKASALESGWSKSLNQPEDLAQQGLLDGRILDRVLRRGDIFAQYRILGFIAAGGMGEIYAAERLDDDGARRQPVALKVVAAEFSQDPDIINGLRREAELCSSVFSSHVVGMYEYGVDETGRGFVAMEFLFGEELFDRMKAHKLFPLKELAELSLQMLEALDDIHSEGIVHRDIKPENIFLAKSPRGEVVKILDFGIACQLDDPNDPLLSKPGQIFGTPQYLAPEQTRSPKVDGRADIYSLGVVLYECANGSPPFDKETPYATMLAHQKEPVPPLPSSFDIEFCEIIYRALAKNPDDRFQSAREMRQVLETWIDETSWVDGFIGFGGGSFALPRENSDVGFDDIASQVSSSSPSPAPAAARDTPFMPHAAVVKHSTRKSQEMARPETPMFPMQRVAQSTPAPGMHSLKQVKEDSALSAFDDGLSDIFGDVSSIQEDNAPIELALTRDEEAQRAMARKAAQRQPIDLEARDEAIEKRRQSQQLQRPHPVDSSQKQAQSEREKNTTMMYVIVITIIVLIGGAIAGAIIAKGQNQQQPEKGPTIIE